MQKQPEHSLLWLLSPWKGLAVLWSLVSTAVDSALVFWRTVWAALLFYKLFWEVIFQLVQEGCSSVSSWLEEAGEVTQGDKTLSSPPESPRPWETGAERHLEAQVMRLQASSNVALGRLSALESGVRYLSQELRAERLLWSSRYLELLREQQGLAVQLQRQEQRLWSSNLEGLSEAPQEMLRQSWDPHEEEEEEEQEPSHPTVGPGPKWAAKE
ncbi:uncharacterized protein LOC134293873 isoform X2 [Anolis carolinensis]|uniref:uncharacterized protein LOC134293873 isoform X2 n=1 Tax=Anolis carolinensis TaxID=28377 RepID=UPI002F2B9065